MSVDSCLGEYPRDSCSGVFSGDLAGGIGENVRHNGRGRLHSEPLDVPDAWPPHSCG